MKKLGSLLLIMAMLFVACEGGFEDGKLPNEGGNTNSEYITLDEGSTALLQQTVGCNAITASGITFTTTEAWRATVEEVRAEEPWLSISPDHGDAGTHTLTITLQENTSEKARKADIVIKCNTAAVKITITQEGAEPQITPTLPQVDEKDRIVAIVSGGYDNVWRRTFFEYNDAGQIVEIRYETVKNDKLDRVITQTFEYNGRLVKISAERKQIFQVEYPQPHNLLITCTGGGQAVLNDNGTLESYEYSCNYKYSLNAPAESRGAHFAVTYGTNGRVSKYTDMEEEEVAGLFTWKDGVLTDFFSEEIEINLPVTYTDIDNVWGGVDWFWVMVYAGDFYSDTEMPLAVLNTNCGMYSSKLPSSLTAEYEGEAETYEFSYTFNDRGQLASISMWDDEVSYFYYPEDELTGYTWPDYVTKQEVIEHHNETIGETGGYRKCCTVRTYLGKENYFDTEYTKDYEFNLQEGGMIHRGIDIDDESEYTNAAYSRYNVEQHVDEYERVTNKVYVNFTTFSLDFDWEFFNMGGADPWKYDLATGEEIAIEWPNEDWSAYFYFAEKERAKGGLSDGYDEETGTSGKIQYCYIKYDICVGFGSETHRPTTYTPTFNEILVDMQLWIPDEQ